MKKRFLIMLTAVVLTMSVSLTVFAQPSAEGRPIVDVDQVVDSSGNVLDENSCHVIRVGNLEGQELELAKDIVKPENLKLVLGEEEAQKSWTAFNFDAYVYDTVEKEEVEWEEGEYHFPVTIKFKVPGVKPGNNVKVLHYYPDSWHAEQVVKVEKDYVSVTFAHLSPVVIMVDSPVSSGASTPTSPQTGEGNVMLYGVLMACIGLAGVVIYRRRQSL